jgi:hypothetical protein
LGQVPPGCYHDKDMADQVLLTILYLAHARNNKTVSRRADNLRLASLLVLAFAIALGIWLLTQ